MEDLKCSVIHLGHSTFLVETPSSKLIFDYFNDVPILSEGNVENGILSEDIFKTEKNIFVFVSHSHSDHYNPVIFRWKEINPNIEYILSSDVKEEIEEEGFYYMDPYETLRLKDIQVKTYGSTDRGASFLVHVDHLNIFHSGDLNWWHWKSFTKEQQKIEEDDFKREVDRIIGNPIDIAFVPVDPRLEEFYHLAGVYFAETIKPKFLVPMHFRDQFSIGKEFGRLLEQSAVKVPEFERIGQKLLF